MKRIIFFLFVLIFFTGCSRTMPDVTGKSTGEAISELKEIGIDESRITIEKEFSDTVEKGCVISSGFEPGEKIDSNSDVQLTVSMGKGEYLLSRTVENSDNYKWEIIQEYDENGYEVFRKFIRSSQDYSDEDTYNFEYEFDSEGRVIRQDCEYLMDGDYKGNWFESYVYSYDEHGNEVSEKRYSKNSDVPFFEKHISYRYDDDEVTGMKMTYNDYYEEWVLEYNGNRVESLAIYINDALYSTLKYSYDKDENIIEMKLEVVNPNIAEYTWNIESFERGPWMLDFYPEAKNYIPYPEDVAQYNDSIIGSNVSEDIVFDYSDGEIVMAKSKSFKLNIETDDDLIKTVSYLFGDTETEYKYDVKGSLISKTNTYEDGTRTGITYVYDDDGKLVKEQSSSYETGTNYQYYDVRKTIYGYDSNGNLIGKTEYSEYSNNGEAVSYVGSYIYEYAGPFKEIPVYEARNVKLTGPMMPD